MIKSATRFFWTSGRKCNFKGCDREDLKPVIVKGWFWSGSGVRLGNYDIQWFEYREYLYFSNILAVVRSSISYHCKTDKNQERARYLSKFSKSSLVYLLVILLGEVGSIKP